VLTALEIIIFQPAEPSARAISSVASNKSMPVPPSPRPACCSRFELLEGEIVPH
jgi:hypothetical protein